MKHLQQFFRFVSCLIVGLVAFSWGQTTLSHAATLSDGLYQVPMKIIKADSTATSTANQFFGNTAVIRVKDDQVTVLITSNGEQYIKSMKVAGQTVTLVKTANKQAIYQFNLTAQTSPLTTTFKLTTPLGSMNETARLTLDFAQAKQVSSSLTTADLLAQAEKVTQAAASSSSSSLKIPKTTAAKSSAKTTSTKTSTAAKTSGTTEYWRYQVLQGSKMTKSEANQYYTDVATVTPKGNGYLVKLNVKYAKSLKLGSKAVVPESIDGVKPQNVTYGKSGSDYTMSYTFTVAKRSDLTKKLIPGKIHVTVPAMAISQTFPIRFRFARSGAADQASAANVAALPKKTNTAAAATPASANSESQRHQTTLPPTGETSSNWSVLGIIGLGLSLLIWWGGRRDA
ncbi:NEAT domain-containing protein [Levilactobacillus cerevisiae]|uniref:NEAT domain-containing protein n=1 Tax=Levilactobacillus cerevisiae TaxID=1704076 RepID=UPI000F78E538|nr:NEAT domain-containing protein [Levilactobacillus cerevisiae]